MPDIVVHHAMGEQVLSRLAPEIAGLIDPDIFGVSVTGPDPYQCYRFFLPRKFRAKIKKRSGIMHSSRTGAFLMELAQHSQRAEVFSFLAGFLCHYALDSTTHPFINREAAALQTATGKKDLHTAIEHRLDILALRRQGKQLRDIMALFPPCPDLPEVWASMKKIYGWNNTLYRISYHYLVFYYWLVKDQHGALLFLLERFYPSRIAKSYQNHLADELDLSPFDRLEQEAVGLGIELISAAYRFRAGEISKEKLSTIIGNRSYSGGEASL